MNKALTIASRPFSRRSFMYGATALLSQTKSRAAGNIAPLARVADTSALKRAAKSSGKTIGMFTGAFELLFDPKASEIIATTYSMIAVGNDLKFSDRLRPTPDTFNFAPGDCGLNWAETHGLLFRGHCLVWWNALPKWFPSYATPTNAKQVMTDHITAVVKHYAGRIYSWDVVNEAIHNDGADNLRRKPWLDLIGPEYIDTAFHTARAADPRARLVLNECYIEHDTPAEIERRSALLALAARLKKRGVPITTIGVQGHLRGNTPLDKTGMVTFLKQVQDLGLETMITELDVDDVDVPGPMIDQTVASKYGEFIDLVGPYVKAITFEAVIDYPNLPKRADGLLPRPNLLDAQYQTTLAYGAAVTAMTKLQQR